MKTATRLLLGFVTTALLTAGFARAAERFDPIAASDNLQSGFTPDGSPVMGCSMPCMSCDSGDDNPN